MSAPSLLLEKKEHIHFGHFSAIVFCAIFLITLAMFKGGYKIFQNPSLGQIPKHKIFTYEEAKAEAEEKFAKASDAGQRFENQLGQDYQQLAMIDPNFGQGTVLGLSTDTFESLDLSKASEALTPQLLESVPVNVVNDSSPEAIENYFAEITDGELEAKIFVFLELLSRDNSVNLDQELGSLLESFLSIPVPGPAVEYQKLNMLHYFLLAEAYKESNLPRDQQAESGADDLLLAVAERLAEIKKQFADKYGVEL